MKVIFEREYSAESLIDAPEDIGNMNMDNLPVDEYGFQKGTFKITVQWSMEEDKNE